MRIGLLFIGAPLFVVAMGTYIYIRLFLRIKDDLEEVYHEFEEQHEGYARYLRWERTCLTAACLAALLLFLALVF
jgi:hypothetical protein